MKYLYLSFYLLFSFCALPYNSIAQKVRLIQIEQADEYQQTNINGIVYQKLKGNVILSHEGTRMFCDSALIDKVENAMEALGNVIIAKGDSFKLFGNKVDYSGNKKLAIVRGKEVKLIHNNITLTTDRLDYDMSANIATYFNWGKVVQTGGNVLVSKKGYYHQNTEEMYFKEKVVIRSNDYIIESDTLLYRVPYKEAVFLGATYIYRSGDTLYSEKGKFFSETGNAVFTKNARMKSGTTLLKADTIEYYKKKQLGISYGNVSITDLIEQMSLLGDYGEYYQKTEKSMVRGRVIASKYMETDTLHITGDTLISNLDTTSKKRTIIAYKNVKVFSRQFQAKCDSLTYQGSDSVVLLEQNPVMWMNDFQASGQKIQLYIVNSKADKLEVLKKAFIVQTAGIDLFNQVKGRNMYGFFTDNKLSLLEVKGNCESVYYAQDDNKAYIGLNKVQSSDAKIQFKLGKINAISFQNKPEGKMLPMGNLTQADKILEGFTNRFSERPLSVDDLKKGFAPKTPPTPKKTIHIPKPTTKKPASKKQLSPLKK